MFSVRFTGTSESASNLSQYFLNRLRRLLCHPAKDAGAPTLRRAIYSTYLDCRDVGATSEARSLLVRYLGGQAVEPQLELVPVRRVETSSHQRERWSD